MEGDVPLGRGCQAHVQASKARRRDLRDIDPAYRTPSELEGRCEQVDGNKCHISGSANLAALRWRVKPDVEAQVEHHDSHDDAGPHEALLAAKGVGEEYEEEAARDHFDDAVDAGGEEGVGVAGNA